MTGVASGNGILLLAVNIGQVRPLGPGEVASAIAKRAVSGRIKVGRFGLAGDEQADRAHHGGLDKALHLYPSEHYFAWQSELPARSERFQIGGFGENLSTWGLDEGNACLGDMFQLGTAVIEVSQGRQPCAKLNLRFDVPDMVQRVHESGRSGWYCRVVSEGDVAAGEGMRLLDRPLPEWPLTRLWTVLFGKDIDSDALSELAAHPVLSEHWKARATRRLSA
jgi:MOSC domain-containing protein YiiM